MNSFFNSFLANNLKRTLAFLAIVLFIFLGMNFFIWREYAAFIALLISSALIEKFRISNSCFSFGLMPVRKAIKESITGLLLPLLCTVFFLLIFAFYGAKISINNNFNTPLFLQMSLLVFIMAANEEIFFRGIIFQALSERYGKYHVAIIISLLFSAIHHFNEGSNTVSALNTFLAGLLFSVAYLHTLSLWLPISFHFFWNFFTSFLLNSPVSGFDFGLNIFVIDFRNLSWIFTGGSYGVEGSLITTIMLTAAIIYLIQCLSPQAEISAFHFRRDFAESRLNSKEPKTTNNFCQSTC